MRLCFRNCLQVPFLSCTSPLTRPPSEVRACVLLVALVALLLLLLLLLLLVLLLFLLLFLLLLLVLVLVTASLMWLSFASTAFFGACGLLDALLFDTDQTADGQVSKAKLYPQDLAFLLRVPLVLIIDSPAAPSFLVRVVRVCVCECACACACACVRLCVFTRGCFQMFTFTQRCPSLSLVRTAILGAVCHEPALNAAVSGHESARLARGMGEPLQVLHLCCLPYRPVCVPLDDCQEVGRVCC